MLLSGPAYIAISARIDPQPALAVSDSVPPIGTLPFSPVPAIHATRIVSTTPTKQPVQNAQSAGVRVPIVNVRSAMGEVAIRWSARRAIRAGRRSRLHQSAACRRNTASTDGTARRFTRRSYRAGGIRALDSRRARPGGQTGTCASQASATSLKRSRVVEAVAKTARAAITGFPLRSPRFPARCAARRPGWRRPPRRYSRPAPDARRGSVDALR